MPYEYNPLLKENLQKSGDSSDIQAEIDALQSAIDTLQNNLNTLQSNLNTLKNSKITKVTAAAQLSDLTNGEIFEWQAATNAQFTQGYFYKVNNGSYTRVDLQPNYTLPIAAANTLGGVMVGNGLDIDENGVLSAVAGDSLKVPRCFSQAQINALTDNDIFEWQGETTADYVQGYFYKKTSNTTVLIESGATYLNNTFGPYIRENYSVQNGYYKFIEETNDIVNGYFINVNSDRTRFYCSLMPAVVGQVAIVTTEAHVGGDFIEFVTVTAVNSYGYPSEYSDGVSVSFSSYPQSNNSKICKYQNVKTNDFVYFPVSPNGGYPFAYFALILDNGVYYPIGRLTANVYVATTDITETSIITAQKDTQPQPQNATTTAAGLMSAADKSKINLYTNDFSNNVVNFIPDIQNIRNNIVSGQSIANIISNLYNSALQGISANTLNNSVADGVGWFQIATFSLQWGVSAIFDCFICGNYGEYNFGSIKFTIIVNAFAWNVMNIINSANHLTKVRLMTSDGNRNHVVFLEIYKDVPDQIVPSLRFVGIPAIQTIYFAQHDNSMSQWLSEINITQS